VIQTQVNANESYFFYRFMAVLMEYLFFLQAHDSTYGVSIFFLQVHDSTCGVSIFFYRFMTVLMEYLFFSTGS
jgi:hypothetical protein